MRGHNDEAEDKKLFGKMLKKAMPHKKVEKHLEADIKEQKKGIKRDRHLIGSIRGKRGH